MECSATGYKTFLIGCNVALMFVGVSVLLLGVKMEQLLSAILLYGVPEIGRSVKAVIATGVFISCTGVTGMLGACIATPFPIMLHLVALGLIVVMEFGIGVTLLVVRKIVENYIESLECNSNCATTLDALVLDYALPSAGLMLTIIIVEAVMMYSALKMLSYLRECPKIIEPGMSDIEHDVQMKSVAAPINPHHYTPHPDRTFLMSPHTRYPPTNTSSPAENTTFLSTPHTWNTDISPNRTFTASPDAWYTPGGCMQVHQPLTFTMSPQCEATKPPLFTSLPQHMQLPPPPYEQAEPLVPASGTPSVSVKRERSGSCNSV